MHLFSSPRDVMVSVSCKILFIVALISQTGCTGMFMSAGATVGVAASQERGIEGFARDVKLATQIRTSYLENDATLATNIGIEVYDGRALLTGLVADEKLRARAVKLAWEIPGTQDVLNEIQIRNEEGIIEFAYDSWISAQLQTKLTFDQNILAINYSIETVNAVIYLIGIAQSDDELAQVLKHAKNINRVRRVISHVRIKGISG